MWKKFKLMSAQVTEHSRGQPDKTFQESMQWTVCFTEDQKCIG